MQCEGPGRWVCPFVGCPDEGSLGLRHMYVHSALGQLTVHLERQMHGCWLRVVDTWMMKLALVIPSDGLFTFM